ncbi:MAG: glycosyltransferase family 4 protein [Candidatus Kerfeldbacteria bacterium]|nr:glycosyltransferase family 4 protein [Candidatus Kerfeldbacteria bacterium]
MRIGIDARFFGGEQSKGLGRYTQKLIEYLAETTSDDTYVIFLQPESIPHWTITDPRFEIVKAPYRWYTLAEQIFMPLTIARAHVDLMHFPHFNVPLLYRRPYIVTIHDLIILHFATERATTLGPLLYWFKHQAGQMVMRHAVHHAQHILTVSEFSKRDIINYYGIDDSLVSVTYEAAEVQDSLVFNEKEQERVLRTYGITGRYVLYIGNAYPHKNLEMLIEAASQYKKTRGSEQLRFVFVGKEDYFYSRLKHLAWAKNVDDIVTFTGFVPDNELPVLYHNALVYAFPSAYEGFGLPPLEAMALGTPVVSSNASCLPEILGDAALYFDPHDVSGILQAIHRVMNSSEQRELLIARGLRRVRQFSWKRMAEQTVSMYAKYRSKSTS